MKNYIYIFIDYYLREIYYMEYKIVKIAIWFICIEDKDIVGVHRLIIFIHIFMIILHLK
jgi:hypothetical protein